MKPKTNRPESQEAPIEATQEAVGRGGPPLPSRLGRGAPERGPGDPQGGVPGSQASQPLNSLPVNDRFVADLIEKAIAKKITQKKAAEVLGLSLRQVQRMVKQYRRRSAEELKRKKSDKPPHNALMAEAKLLIVEMAKTQFQSYGLTLISKYMNEYLGFRVGKETVRRVLMEHDIWEPGKFARIARKPRLRRAYFGELVQIDSSYHQWLTGDATCYWLNNNNIIDDATGRIFCRFVDSDSYRTNMSVFKSYIEVHGRPKEVYTDRASHFCDNIPKGAERKKAITQWERAMGSVNQKLQGEITKF